MSDINVMSLADGKIIAAIRYYTGEEQHMSLAETMGKYWFEHDVLLPLCARYKPESTIAAVYFNSSHYFIKGAARYGIGDTPEEAVKDALKGVLEQVKPVVTQVERILKKLS